MDEHDLRHNQGIVDLVQNQRNTERSQRNDHLDGYIQSTSVQNSQNPDDTVCTSAHNWIDRCEQSQEKPDVQI